MSIMRHISQQSNVSKFVQAEIAEISCRRHAPLQCLFIAVQDYQCKDKSNDEYITIEYMTKGNR